MKRVAGLILILLSGAIFASETEVDVSKGYVIARLVGYSVQDNYYVPSKKRYYKKRYYKKRYYPKKKVYRKKYVRPVAKPDTYRYVAPRITDEKKIQKALSGLGFYRGAIDGSLHAYETRMAIKKMNEAYGRGSIATLSVEAKSTLIFLSTLFDFDKTLINASTRRYTRNKRVQTALKILGYYHGSIDGSIGSNTRRAIAEYKQSMGLTASSHMSYDEEGQLIDSAKSANDKNIEDAIGSLQGAAARSTGSS
jgi:peptidoglycan hydrolase-like protein with peptidoglycan-binding domain